MYLLIQPREHLNTIEYPFNARHDRQTDTKRHNMKRQYCSMTALATARYAQHRQRNRMQHAPTEINDRSDVFRTSASTRTHTVMSHDTQHMNCSCTNPSQNQFLLHTVTPGCPLLSPHLSLIAHLSATSHNTKCSGSLVWLWLFLSQSA
jgi:hypothetical protein